MDKVFLALDNMTDIQIREFLTEYKDNIVNIKIGMEVFYKYGHTFIQELNDKFNFNIFLDLKLHDIPHTVASSIKSLSGLSIGYLTLHLSGGNEMVAQAKRARDEFLPNTKLIGVTVLTSLDQYDCLKVYNQETKTLFKNLYSIALAEKIDGLVCSGQELELLPLTNDLVTICPGIRFDETQTHDQKRVMTPKEAFDKGADYLVIGRSLRSNPEIIRQKEYWSKLSK